MADGKKRREEQPQQSAVNNGISDVLFTDPAKFQPRRAGSLNTALELVKLLVENNDKARELFFTRPDEFFERAAGYLDGLCRIAESVEQRIIQGFDLSYSPETARPGPPAEKQLSYISSLYDKLNVDEKSRRKPETAEEASRLIEELRGQAEKASGSPEQKGSTKDKEQKTGKEKQTSSVPTKNQMKLIETLYGELGIPDDKRSVPLTKKEAGKLIDELIKKKQEVMQKEQSQREPACADEAVPF